MGKQDAKDTLMDDLKGVVGKVLERELYWIDGGCGE